MRRQAVRATDRPLTIAAIGMTVVAVLVLVVDGVLLAFGAERVSAFLGSALASILPLVFLLCFVVGFVIGYRAHPLVSLNVMLAMIITERFHGSLLPSGAINLRFDEVVVPAITVGILYRQWQVRWWRDREWQDGPLRSLRGLVQDLRAVVPGLVPLGLFLIANLIPTLFVMHDRARGMSLYTILVAGAVCYVGAFVLASQVGRTLSILRPLFTVGALEALFGLVSLGLSVVLARPDWFGVQPDAATGAVEPYGTMYEANFFGQYLASILLLSTVLLVELALHRRLTKWQARGLGFVAAVTAAGTLASLTRASWLAFVVGVIVIGVLWPVRSVGGLDKQRTGTSNRESTWVRWLPSALTATVVVIGGAATIALANTPTALGARLSSILDFSSGSGYGRLRVFNLIAQDWHNPILGMGDGSFNLTLPPLPGHAPDAPWIYSMFLAVLHDSGIVGMALFLWFLGVVVWGLIKTIRTAAQPEAQALAFGMLGVLTILLVAGQATTSMYLIFFWVFLGLAAAVPLIARRGAAVDEQETLVLVAVNSGTAAVAPPRVGEGAREWRERVAAFLPQALATVVMSPDMVTTTIMPALSLASTSRVAVSIRRHIAVVLALGCGIGLLYGGAISTNFMADEWGLLQLASEGPSSITVPVAYHFTPITQAANWLLYQIFGQNPPPYILLELLLFWACSVALYFVSLQLTGRFAVSALGALLFVAFGSQYEVPLWGLAMYWQTLGLLVFLGGLALYIYSTNERAKRGPRAWAYTGFLACLAVGPFIYEQELALIGVCALYRLFVAEHGYSFSYRFSWNESMSRVIQALRDLGPAILLVVVYFGFAEWLRSQIGATETAGLAILAQYGAGYTASYAAVGIFQAFVPGLALGPLPQMKSILFDWLTVHQLRGFIPVAVAVAGLSALLRPVHRFLLLWAALMVLASALVIGPMASRHLLLVTAPGCLLWAALIVGMVGFLRARSSNLSQRNLAAVMAVAPSAILALLIIGLGSQFALSETETWQQASTQLDDVIAQMTVVIHEHPSANILYLVDLPDCLPPPNHPDDCAYMFRNAGPAIVQMKISQQFNNIYVAYTRTDVYMSGTQMTSAQLDTLSEAPGVLVLQYNWHTGTLAPHVPGG